MQWEDALLRTVATHVMTGKEGGVHSPELLNRLVPATMSAMPPGKVYDTW